MHTLTPIQAEVLTFVRQRIAAGLPPTRREIRDHFRWKSDNAAQEHLLAIQAKGYVVLTGGISRGIALAKSEESAP